MTTQKQNPDGADRAVLQGILDRMTVPEVEAFRPEVMVIPLGSTEPHGPHLPYGTDSLIAGRITEEAVRRANCEGARVLLLPVLPFGNNVNFKDFLFACRIRVETLMAVLMDLVAFGLEEGVHKVVIYNGHGGNEAAATAALRQIFDRFQNDVFAALCTCGCFFKDPGQALFGDGSPHAGEFETSLLQAIAPEKLPHTLPQPSPMNEPQIPSLRRHPVVWVRNWAHLMPAAYGGRPDRAERAKGDQFFEAEVTGLAGLLKELSSAAWHPRFPYA